MEVQQLAEPRFPTEYRATFIPQPLHVLVVYDPDTCPCGARAEIGITGVVKGRVRSLSRCQRCYNAEKRSLS